ncbi:cytosolic phospholipase A2 gamma-like [Gracilinanus agilis]|uniref:cytosolic phospholipase A2 gamma-like n=1 Tax=Gracilinanus agilis TaxID=191870 RepID=UPI001CFD55AF|nr:cytosolic phospholipase A2 gamma-like [Gracilinanus agilis]
MVPPSGLMALCMSSLYTKSDGWQNLQKAEDELRRRLQKDKWNFSHALSGLCMAATRDDYSLTDFWSYTLVYFLTKELLHANLSCSRGQSEAGTVPYPIFATIDHYLQPEGKEKTLKSWFEFTPHTAGYPTPGLSTPGAYVSTTYYGSKFKAGKLIQQEAERDLSYLRGLFGSALADRNSILTSVKDFLLKFIRQDSTQEKSLLRLLSKEIEGKGLVPEGDILQIIMEELVILVYTFTSGGDCLPVLESLHSKMAGYKGFSEAQTMTNKMIKHLRHNSPDQQRQYILDLLTKVLKHDAKEERNIPSFLQFIWKTSKCLLFWTWGTTNNFLYKYGDIKDKDLTDRENLYLMDAGLDINCAYPLVLPPVRNTDIILSFDFSEGDPFLTIKDTAKYCKTCNIPFPPVDEDKLNQDAQAPSDFYIFEREKGPVVMHFPLFNKVNCGSAEVIEKRCETFKTFRLKDYSDDEVCQLLEDAKANVRNNKERILEKICKLAQTAS